MIVRSSFIMPVRAGRSRALPRRRALCYLASSSYELSSFDSFTVLPQLQFPDPVDWIEFFPDYRCPVLPTPVEWSTFLDGPAVLPVPSSCSWMGWLIVVPSSDCAPCPVDVLRAACRTCRYACLPPSPVNEFCYLQHTFYLALVAFQPTLRVLPHRALPRTTQRAARAYATRLPVPAARPVRSQFAFPVPSDQIGCIRITCYLRARIDGLPSGLPPSWFAAALPLPPRLRAAQLTRYPGRPVDPGAQHAFTTAPAACGPGAVPS